MIYIYISLSYLSNLCLSVCLFGLRLPKMATYCYQGAKFLLPTGLSFSAEGKGEKVKEKEDKREKAVRLWKEAVTDCQTYSRLHVLMAIADSCIKWEKSAENAVCKYTAAKKYI